MISTERALFKMVMDTGQYNWPGHRTINLKMFRTRTLQLLLCIAPSTNHVSQSFKVHANGLIVSVNDLISHNMGTNMTNPSFCLTINCLRVGKDI